MNWKEAISEWGPASLQFLSTDGASITFLVVGDPIKLETKYNRKPQTRMACPCVTEDGFYLFVGGLRIARKIASLSDKLEDHVITVTRHGAEGDVNAKYDVVATNDSAKVARLKSIALQTFSQEALEEAIAEAIEVSQR